MVILSIIKSSSLKQNQKNKLTYLPSVASVELTAKIGRVVIHIAANILKKLSEAYSAEVQINMFMTVAVEANFSAFLD